MRISRIPFSVWCLLAIAAMTAAFYFASTSVLEGLTPGQNTKMCVRSIEFKVCTFKNTHGVWPNSLKDLTDQQPDGHPPLLTESSLLDAWGRPCHYDVNQKHPATDIPLIWSDGPDPDDPTGKITNWQP